jgi:hypothetical protein
MPKDEDENKNDSPPATGGGTNDGLGDAGKRALQAERERAKKAEADAKATRDELAKLKAADDAKKSDMDKLIEKISAMEKRAADAEQRALLGEVVAETGLSMAKVQRLRGSTVEELMTDAESVFDWKPKPEGDQPTPSTPSTPSTPPIVRQREKLTPDPGPGSTSPPVEDDRSKILAAIPRL